MTTRSIWWCTTHCASEKSGGVCWAYVLPSDSSLYRSPLPINNCTWLEVMLPALVP